MPDESTHISTIEPDLLVATCGSDGSVISRNLAWNSVLGKDDELWSRLLSNDREIAVQNLNEAISGSLVTHALFLVEPEDRDIPTPILLHFIPIGLNTTDASYAVAISGEVLSEPKSWTESQTHRHRMETLGRMTMGMAHDFNNLLGGILGHIELWRLEAELDERARDHVSTIEQAALDGANLISKVQRYIRQEAQSSFQRLDLGALIVECIAFTRPYWLNEPRRQGINIEVEHQLDGLPPVEGSAAELRDVMVNLILNAVHAMPEGGIIRIEGVTTEHEVTVRVTDTGTGMSDDIQRRIFEPLYSTKGEQGTGMGLAVVASTMREHQGTISLQSELGKGSTFTLRFPLLEVASAEARKSDESRMTRPSWKLLVVDDEEMVRSVIARLLILRGHEVTQAESGREALEYFSKNDFDFVLTDQGMPHMSGRELAHQIRKTNTDIPILLLTGDTDIKVNPAHINHVLTKPFKIDEIESVITSLT